MSGEATADEAGRDEAEEAERDEQAATAALRSTPRMSTLTIIITTTMNNGTMG